MGSEDDTLIMPRGNGGGSGGEQTPPGGGGPGSPARREKIIIISVIAGIFIIAAVIVIAIRTCGGDEPAPQSRTVIQTVTETTTVTETIPTETDTVDDPPVRGDLRGVNWDSEVGAQPLVRYVEDVIYSDLTGNGFEDALVLVRSEGSGAYLDYYVYTYEGESLVLLFEKTDVVHGSVEPGSIPRSIVETTSVYAPEDPNCCPSQLQITTYTWSSSAGAFVETSVEVVPNPAL